MIFAEKGCVVRGHCEGIAASGAALVIAAADQVFVQPDASVMIHSPRYCNGQEPDERLAVMCAGMVRRLAGKLGRGKDAVVDLLSAGKWMTASEAVELGLADEVLGDEGLKSMSISERFESIPPAAMAAYEKGQRRMEARLARVTAHADAAPPRPEPVAAVDHAAEMAARAALQREHQIRCAYSSAASLDLPANVVDRMIDAGISPEALGDELVRVFAMNKSKDAFRMTHADSGSRIISSYEDPANFMEAMSDAIAFPALKALNLNHKLPDNGARNT